MTTPRDLVKQCLEFEGPERVPRQLWVLPWAISKYPQAVARIQSRFPDDILASPLCYRQQPRTQGDRYSVGVYIDEWGCRFENIQEGIIGVVRQPLLENWDDLDRVRPPRELLSVDLEEVNSFCRATDRFVLANTTVRPFERLQFLRTSENLFLDLVDQPPELFELLNRLHTFYLEEFEVWAETEVDALTFQDDWGTQTSLLISPQLWRRMFKPLYADYVRIAHDHGKYVFMHSDGYIVDIIPDLIELGVDAINSQIFTMDLEELGKRFRGQITFWGEIDRQHTLAHGSREEVIAAVRSVRESLYDNGGAIAQCEFGVGAKPENVELVFETWEQTL